MSCEGGVSDSRQKFDFLEILLVNQFSLFLTQVFPPPTPYISNLNLTCDTSKPHEDGQVEKKLYKSDYRQGLNLTFWSSENFRCLL